MFKKLIKKTGTVFESNHYWGYLFVAPVLVGFLIFMLYPLIMGIYLSLFDVGLLSREFVGFENYVRLASDEYFGRAIIFSVLYTVGIVIFSISTSFLLAILVNKKLKGISIYRVIIYLPVISMLMASALIWKGLLAQSGVINNFLGLFGISPVAFLTEAIPGLIGIIMLSVWKGAGFNMVLFLAGLQNIPKSLYEAAELDGANKRQQVWYVTIPMLIPTVFFVTITTVINSMQVFEQPLILTAGGPSGRTTSMVFYIYNNAFRFGSPGYASTQATILFIILGIVTIGQLRLQKRWSN